MMFVVFYVFASYPSALHTSLARVQGFSLLITTHNSTALKVNGMTEDILFVVLFAQRVFASGYQTQKGPIFIPTIFLFFFSCLLTCTNPATLMDAEQWVKALLLLRLFEPSVFYNRCAT